MVMIKTFTVCLGILLICSGCQSLTPSKSNIQSIDKQTMPAVAKIAPRKHVNFAPQYHSELTDKYPDAINIYDSSPNASQGIYQHEGLVFVIVEIDTNQESIEYLEGTAMLRVIALLRKKYPNLPPRFSIRNRLVEKRHDDETGFYRYAVAYREADIKAKLAN